MSKLRQGALFRSSLPTAVHKIHDENHHHLLHHPQHSPKAYYNTFFSPSIAQEEDDHNDDDDEKRTSSSWLHYSLSGSTARRWRRRSLEETIIDALYMHFTCVLHRASIKARCWRNLPHSKRARSAWRNMAQQAIRSRSIPAQPALITITI